MNLIRIMTLDRTAAFLAVAILGLAGGVVSAAQETDAGGQTNEPTDAEVLSRLGELIQAATAGPADEMTPPSGQPAPGSSPPAGTPPPSADQGGNRFARPDSSKRPDTGNRFDSASRSQNDRSKSRRGKSGKSGKSAPSRSYGSSRDYGQDGDSSDSAAGTNAGPTSLEYASFKLIVDRNIFDPNRFPRSSPRPTRALSRVDSLTLVGTMSYDKGTFAFFDGTSADYKKALKQTDVIVGYKVTNITPTSVTLAAGTNQLNLGVGMQLRREEDGPWRLSGQSGSYAAFAAASSTSTNAASATSTDSTSSAAEADIIKRLMQKRQQE